MSKNSYLRTQNLDFLLFGTLFVVRVLLPPSNVFKIESRLGLIIHDAFYITDSIDFSTVLFDSPKKIFNNNYKNLVLCILAFTCTFYSFDAANVSSIRIRKNIFSRITHSLVYDPLVKLLLPCLFYDLPIIVARTTIFYGFKSINLDNFAFLLKNIISIVIKMIEYWEIRIKLKANDYLVESNQML